jgi:hypothetical protein
MISRRIKLCVIAAIILQLIALLLINLNIASGYELGVYQNVPVEVWVLLALSTMISFFILYCALRNGQGLFFFIFLVISISLIFISLPAMRGYAFYDNYDSLSHIGTEKDIISTGGLSSDDFYPIMHIWVVMLSLASGITPFILVKYLPLLIYVLLFIFMILLDVGIYNKNKIILLLYTGLSTILFLKSDYYTTLVSNGFSMIFVPLLFYLYVKKSSIHKLLLFICLLIIPFTHPLTTIILLILFIIYELSKILYHKISGVVETINLSPILILLISFLAWAVSYSIFAYKVNYALLLITMGSTSPIAYIGNSFGKLNMGMIDSIIWILKVYSPNIILGLLSLIAIAIIFFEIYKKHKVPEHRILFPFAISYILLGTVLSLLVIVGDPGVEALRDFNFIFLFSIPLAAYALAKFYAAIKSFKYLQIFIILLLIGLPYFISLFSIYESPYINLPGKHVTYAQIDGADWFFIHKSEKISSAIVPSAAPWRISDLTNGIKIKETRTDIGYNYDTTNWIDIPDHFENLSLAIQGRYLLYDKMDYLSYTQLWQLRYSESDFVSLDDNAGVSKLYTNNDQVVYYVH